MCPKQIQYVASDTHASLPVPRLAHGKYGTEPPPSATSDALLQGCTRECLHNGLRRPRFDRLQLPEHHLLASLGCWFLPALDCEELLPTVCTSLVAMSARTLMIFAAIL